MKTSIYTWFGYYMPFEDRVKAIKEAHFDEVMLSWEDEYPPYELSRFSFADIVYKYGLNITNAHSPFIGYNQIWQNNLTDREDLLRLYKSWVKECSQAGIDTLIVHTNETGLENYKIENGIEFFRELGEYAGEHDFFIAIENVKRQFLLKTVLDNLEMESLGLCYDVGHDYITYCGRGRLLKEYYNRIKAVHYQDNDLYSDKHWLPGEGKIDFTEIMPYIKKSGYDTISLEVKADPNFWAGKSPSEFLASAAESANELKKLII